MAFRSSRSWTSCFGLSSKVKELQAPRWTLLWSTMSGGVPRKWFCIGIKHHQTIHFGGVIILASCTIQMYICLLVSNNIVCFHLSNEDHRSRVSIDSMDSIPPAGSLFLWAWQRSCSTRDAVGKTFVSHPEEMRTAWVIRFVKWFFGDRKSDWHWKMCSNMFQALLNWSETTRGSGHSRPLGHRPFFFYAKPSKRELARAWSGRTAWCPTVPMFFSK